MILNESFKKTDTAKPNDPTLDVSEYVGFTRHISDASLLEKHTYVVSEGSTYDGTVRKI